MKQLQQTIQSLEEAFTVDANQSELSIAIYLCLGGLCALYIRMLYRRFGASTLDSDAFTRVFPLLVIITTTVIAVVKSSLALSLGLVGALSIVRFRAAIKEPEELVYLFLCIAVGLSLGAELPLLALALLLVATVFVIGMHLATRSNRSFNMLLTISGDSSKYFQDDESGVLSAVEKLAKGYSLQRFDIEAGQGQIRVILPKTSPQQTAALMTQLRQQFPECDMSYINIESTI